MITGTGRGALHFICLALDSPAERWWLLHHCFSGGAWQEPRVIDFGSGAFDNYGDLAVDTRGCLHLAYRIAGASHAGLYYRSFDHENNHWSKAVPLSVSAPVDYPSIAVDEAQNLHVLWRTFSEGKYFVCYRFMGGPGWKAVGWKPETVISPGMEEPPFPFFSYRQGELHICWLEGGSLLRYRFNSDRWDRIAPQRLKDPFLIRVKSFSSEGVPLNYRFPLEGGAKTTGAPLSDLLPAEEDNLESDFNKLHRFSGNLLDRISDLSTAKKGLEEEVKTRNKEMLNFSRQSEKSIRLLRQDLDGKDAELKKLQENFDQILGTMKQKIEQGGQRREAERKRYLDELQALKKERRQMETIMQEKEKTISRLEAQIREQKYRIGKLGEEKEMLIAKTSGGLNLKKLWRQIVPHKNP